MKTTNRKWKDESGASLARTTKQEFEDEAPPLMTPEEHRAMKMAESKAERERLNALLKADHERIAQERRAKKP